MSSITERYAIQDERDAQNGIEPYPGAFKALAREEAMDTWHSSRREIVNRGFKELLPEIAMKKFGVLASMDIPQGVNNDHYVTDNFVVHIEGSLEEVRAAIGDRIPMGGEYGKGLRMFEGQDLHKEPIVIIKGTIDEIVSALKEKLPQLKEVQVPEKPDFYAAGKITARETPELAATGAPNKTTGLSAAD